MVDSPSVDCGIRAKEVLNNSIDVQGEENNSIDVQVRHPEPSESGSTCEEGNISIQSIVFYLFFFITLPSLPVSQRH